MKKVLIYSTTTGGGHLQCAKVLEKRLVKQGYKVVIVDFLKEINLALDKFVVNFNYLITGKMPIIYGHLYYGFDNEINHKRFLNLLIKVSRKSIYNNIVLENPDLIIGTHSFLNGIIGYLKESNLIHIPYISIITDYKLHENHIHEYIDAFITGSKDLNHEFLERNIPLDRVYPYGIPIREEFLNKENNTVKNIPFQILLMGGSSGLRGMKKTLKSLSKVNKNIHIRVVCGNNIKLKEYFEREYKGLITEGKITVFGYFNDMATLMNNSHVLITKPGGVSITEAIYMNLPIIVPYFIPGQEKENLKYLIDNGMGIYIKDQRDVGSLIEDLMDNLYVLETMKTNMENIKTDYNIIDIINLCEDLIQQYSSGGGINVL
jgi:processive 1,2-diacylglycerol beta-glucosyltransferase